MLSAIRAEVGRVVVGQQAMIDRLLIGLLCRGHVLLEGVPGLAKTLTVRSLAESLHLRFSRVQFTPDLLPGDVLGTQIYDPREGVFRTHKGPIFANIVLADEINRAPAKVQSALLEAMQERQVTLGEATHKLPDPFLVLATQNPIEQEGTYPLPEAQADRFLLKVKVGYPTKADERAMLERSTEPTPVLRPVADAAALARGQEACRALLMEGVIRDYIVDLVHATRKPKDYGLDLARFLEVGASPRATLALEQAARAHALIDGRAYVTPDDVKAIGADVLRHRVLLTWEAEAEGLSAEDLIAKIFAGVRTP
jgi:MoxR-like ATPase